jgi:hypothetical protein
MFSNRIKTFLSYWNCQCIFIIVNWIWIITYMIHKNLIKLIKSTDKSSQQQSKLSPTRFLQPTWTTMRHNVQCNKSNLLINILIKTFVNGLIYNVFWYSSNS